MRLELQLAARMFRQSTHESVDDGRRACGKSEAP